MDADLCVPMEDTAKLEAALSDSDIAIGSRYAPGARIEVHQPLSREIAGRLFNLYVSRMVLPGYRDTQCGFKLWKWWAARELFARLATTGFAYDVELLRRAREFGFRVREVGVCWRHKDRGSVSLLRDSVRMFRDTWDLRRMVLPQGGGYDA
jgi:dolichyl-phosphate beta-glucosyltransferase